MTDRFLSRLIGLSSRHLHHSAPLPVPLACAKHHAACAKPGAERMTNPPMQRLSKALSCSCHPYPRIDCRVVRGRQRQPPHSGRGCARHAGLLQTKR